MADTSTTEDLARYIGQVVPFTVDPGLLVLSYIISLVGAASTLELIHRRTSRRGYYNNLLLFGAAITMGGVAIWSMHYIGNLATTMLNGEHDVQIAYSPGVTIASLFLPIVVLVVAFFVVTSTTASSTRIVWWRILAAGTLSGGAICGMHYLGNASIKNYNCSYAVGFVAGSVVIAVVASIVALALFFVFRSTWTNLWWKRGCCALVLAGAVSGMHWCAVIGTSYTLLHVDTAMSDIGSRNTTVIVTACLSFAACLTMAGLAIYSARVRKGYAERAQRITLAAAVFDEQGRILVTPDVFLPSEVVTCTFLQKMSQHLSRLPHTGRNVRTGIELVDKDGHIIDNYDIVFCELFCVAASALAHQMNEDLADAGILWDEIMSTGGHSAANPVGQPSTAVMTAYGSSSSFNHELDDLAERGNASPVSRSGHGYLMFLVRRVDSSHVDHLAASGYCFAEPRHVTHMIRSKMQIRTKGLGDKFRAMERYARGVMLEPGVHVGLFAVRTRVHHMGFDVLVRKLARNLLPSMELPLERLEPADLNLLRRLDGMTLGALQRQLERVDNLLPREVKFASLLLDAIRNLQNSVQDPVFANAKLVAKPLPVPCTPPSGDARPTTCSFIAFTIMIPIHLRVEAPAYDFIPLPFFKTQQLVYKNSPHRAVFARSVHRNLSPILNSVPAIDSALFPTKRLRSFIPIPRYLRLSASRTSSQGRAPGEVSSGAVRLDSSAGEHVALTPYNESVSSLLCANGGDARSDMSDHSAVGPVSRRRRRQRQYRPGVSSYGGIMISQEVVVNVEQEGEGELERRRAHDDDDDDDDDDDGDNVPGMPAPTHNTNHRDSSESGEPGLRRQRSQRGLSDMHDEADAGKPPKQGDNMERKPVSKTLRVGVSRTNVTKERDNRITTFVDDIFSICIDSSRKM
ncbi:uncharacterized protein P884DRAFT_194653 [Thermothelomyces heterothallicus CBS 202.75]|uniref:uncharacterized protein n=1 Tax=Thermothelomyces heterothallicus CBS 202.75 TaxID=1149848 RepID=UPI0037432A71